jgi:RecA/RadA recombinase
VISTLDEKLDAALKGGIPVGYITEFVGERCHLDPLMLFNSLSN